ncbi:serine protease [Photobacterium chitinilyticum]|uniref:S1 family serine peptidase n=1 Tax=Photobacterium chitinilyticum TaxID=2485123 RepID=UPI003D149C02
MHKLLIRLLLCWTVWLPFGAVGNEAAGSENENKVTAKIIGGIESADNEIPWQAYLNLTFPNGEGGESTFVCGGVVISADLVLTAAHCLRNGSSIVTPQNIKVWGGIVSVFFASNLNAVSVSEFIMHPSYNSSRFTNDIALLKLASPLPSSAIPIQIADRTTQDRADNAFANGWVANGVREANLLVSGWGTTDPQDSNSGTIRLRETLMSGVPDTTCDAHWGANINASDYPIFVCAGSVSPSLARDSCFGDSGGPLVWQDPQAASDSDFGLRLVGLVSFGNGCAGEVPGVYTEVADYISWIEGEAGRAVLSQPVPVFSVNPFDSNFANAGAGITVPTDSGSSGGGSGGGSTSWGTLWFLLIVGYIRLYRTSIARGVRLRS